MKSYENLPYEARIVFHQKHKILLVCELNKILPQKFLLDIEENSVNDIFLGIDCNTRYIDPIENRRAFVSVKERVPNQKHKKYGKDLLIEVVAVWPPHGLDENVDPRSFLTGRDLHMTHDFIVFVDKDGIVYVFDTSEVIPLAKRMFVEFMVHGRYFKTDDGEVRIFRDPSAYTDHKGLGYLKCGAFINPKALRIRFQSSIPKSAMDNMWELRPEDYEDSGKFDFLEK